MAQQDVRYYLNGMLFETADGHLRAVATDGHRLALCQAELDGKVDEQQVIVPRKGVLELQRLMTSDGDLNIELGANHIRIQLDGIRFTSKLIDGRFPEYERVIPKESSNELKADRGAFKGALQRTAILSNEKYRAFDWLSGTVAWFCRHITRSRKRPKKSWRSSTAVKISRLAST